MSLLFTDQHDGLCVIPLAALWWGDSLPSMQQELWLLFSDYVVLTTNFTYCQWLTLSGAFPLVLILKSGWAIPRVTALLHLGGCKINPSASDSIPAPSTPPCSLRRVERDVYLKEWQSSSAELQAKGPCVPRSASHRVRIQVAPWALLAQVRPACVPKQWCQSLHIFKGMFCFHFLL